MTIKKPDYFWCIVSSAFLVGYVFLAAMANSDLTGGRFALFMDEKVTFDGVRSILYPESFSSFVSTVLDGKDHRYGRSLWNSMALFSFIPAYLYGYEGQIISGRMLQVFLLGISYFILSKVFLESWKYRFLLIAGLLSMPFNDYYSTMPKPEPLQLFFIALFFYFYKISKMRMGLVSWLFLGIAFGTKVSILPVVIVLFTWSIFIEYKLTDGHKTLDSLIRSIGYFLGGLAISVPILAITVILTILSYLLLIYVVGTRFKMPVYILFWIKICLFFSILVISFVISYYTYLHGGKTGIASWGGAILLNSKNAADLGNVNFFIWMHYLLHEWLIAPAVFSYFVTGILLVFLFLNIRGVFKNWLPAERVLLLPYILIVCGAGLCFSIMLTVHRLWGFYLFIGVILMLTGLLSVIEQAFREKAPNDNLKFKQIASVILGVLTILIFVYWIPASITGFQNLASRTQTVEYKKEYQSYLLIDSILSRPVLWINKKSTVLVDPALFMPEKSEYYKIVEFWGPFTAWEQKPDIIILGRTHIMNGANIGPDSVQYPDFLKERTGYQKYVINDAQGCKLEICYERYHTLPNGAEILILKKAITGLN